MRRIILISFLIGLTYQNLIACKCDFSDDIEKSYNDSETIVHGKVISKEFVNVSQSLTGKGLELVCDSYKTDNRILEFLETEFLIKIKLEVIQKYKGESLSKIITTYTAKTTGACGFLSFEIGKEYQVYLSSMCYFDHQFKKANLDKNHYNGFWTNVCTRTKEFDWTEDRKLKELMEK